MVVCRVGVSPARALPAVRTALHPLRTAPEIGGHSGGSACGMRWGLAGGCRCWRRSTSCARTTSTCRRRNSGRFGAPVAPANPVPCRAVPCRTQRPADGNTPRAGFHGSGRRCVSLTHRRVVWRVPPVESRGRLSIAPRREYPGWRVPRLASTQAGEYPGWRVPRLASTQAARIVHSVVCLCGHRPRCAAAAAAAAAAAGDSVGLSARLSALLCVCLSG